MINSSIFLLTLSTLIAIIITELIGRIVFRDFYDESMLLFITSYIIGLGIVCKRKIFSKRAISANNPMREALIFLVISVLLYSLVSYAIFSCLVNYWASAGDRICENPISYITNLFESHSKGLVSYEENGVLVIENGNFTAAGITLKMSFYFKLISIPLLSGFFFGLLNRRMRCTK